MKILFITRRFYPDIKGGGEISALYLAKAAKLAGHEVTVCTFTNKNDSIEIISGIPVYRFKLSNLDLSPRFSNMEFMYLQMFIKASRLIKKLKPNVLHLLNFESIPLSSILFKIRFKSKIVATVNGTQFGCFTGQGLDYNNKTCINCRINKRFYCSKKKWENFKGIIFFVYSIWYMNLLKLSYRFINSFFVVSKAMTPLLTNMGIKKEKIQVIHNPIENNKKIASNLKKKLKISDKKILLYIGRITPSKGIKKIISILPYLKNVVYIIVGKKNDYYLKLKRYIRLNNLENKVIFTGFIDNNDIDKYFSIANSCVLVEPFYEPLSRFLLESLSYGVPIVASKVGGNSEIVNKDVGMLCDYNNEKQIVNCIRRVLKKEFKKSSFVKLVNSHFSLKKISEKLDSAYTKVIR
ncbi:glycosyltransferase family 4 protein [archaeon]|jgi:glycogen synthase|nr:glycosyltransferase family 4 protein [archaeon]MBT4022245.1 glycosyltransferase family 4 protein [archaeon]MBT4460652.1 glycosyltransferase family 4 protein [archaeon]MBT7439616.1 glycosyltransferase family 4 protein [archaeon]